MTDAKYNNVWNIKVDIKKESEEIEMQENEDPWSVKKQQLQVSARIQQICSDVAEEPQVSQNQISWLGALALQRLAQGKWLSLWMSSWLCKMGKIVPSPEKSC